jgi:hypothetical protein
MQHELLTVSKISQLSGCSDGTVRKDADAGRLPVSVRKSDGERLFGAVDGVLYALQRRLGVDVRGVSDQVAAEKVATAITKCTGTAVADAYPAIVAFASMLDDDVCRLQLATAIRSITPGTPLGWK